MGKKTREAGGESLAGLSDADLERTIENMRAELEAEPSSASGAVAKSIHEAARLLKVNASTVARWLSMDGFPGKSGTRGTASGFFPITDIQVWREQTFGSVSGETGCAMRQQLLAAMVAQREAKLREQLGQVAPLEDVAGMFAREISAARSKLEEIPDRIADAIPTTRPKLRRRCAAIADRVVRAVILELAGDIRRLIDGDATPKRRISDDKASVRNRRLCDVPRPARRQS